MDRALTYRQKYYAEHYAARRVIDGTPLLKRVVETRLPKSATVVDIGAGKGNGSHPCRKPAVTLIGVDPSRDVESNSHLDHCYVQEANSLPFGPESVDMVFSDYTFEHLENPLSVLNEARRVLKPGGHFVFRTVNALHYVALCSMLTPKPLYGPALALSGNDPDEHFPTFYRFNTKRAISRALNDLGFEIEEVHCIEGPPDYLVFSKPLYLLGLLYERVTNKFDALTFLRSNIIIAARRVS